MDHGYRIEGNINGRSLLGLGTGKTDPATGVSEMEVSFEKLPDGWDPRTIVLMCCDRTDAAQQITSILIDKELTPDFVLAGMAPEHADVDHQVPDGEGSLRSAARTPWRDSSRRSTPERTPNSPSH